MPLRHRTGQRSGLARQGDTAEQLQRKGHQPVNRAFRRDRRVESTCLCYPRAFGGEGRPALTCGLEPSPCASRVFPGRRCRAPRRLRCRPHRSVERGTDRVVRPSATRSTCTSATAAPIPRHPRQPTTGTSATKPPHNHPSTRFTPNWPRGRFSVTLSVTRRGRQDRDHHRQVDVPAVFPPVPAAR